MLGHSFSEGDAGWKGIRVKRSGEPQVASKKKEDSTEKGLDLTSSLKTSDEPIEGEEAQHRESPHKVYARRAKPIGQDQRIMEGRPKGDQDLESQHDKGGPEGLSIRAGLHRT